MIKASIYRLLEWDNQFSARLRMQPGKNITWRLMAISAHSGDPWYWLIGFTVAWFLTSEPWKTKCAIFLIGIFSLGMITASLKFIFRRNRPPGEWGEIYRKTDPHSFPSGHAARSALLVVLGIGLGPWWLAMALALHAPFVICARVTTGVHYISDVIAGIFVGILFGIIVLIFQPILIVFLRYLPL